MRIGVMIPAYLLYQGHIYTGSGGVYETGASVPSDLSYLGTAPAALDERGAPLSGSSYDIYGIRGVDPGQAVAVKFGAASNNGPLWAWLKYERKK